MVDVAVQPPLSPSLQLWWCCPTPAAMVVVLPLLPLLPLWWPPMALVVVGGAAVATIVWVGVTPLPLRSPLVVVGGAPAAVVVGGGAPHCCHRLVMICMGNPQVIFTIPRPVPVNNPYPLNGCGCSHGLIRLDPRVCPYPYPWWVTPRYPV